MVEQHFSLSEQRLKVLAKTLGVVREDERIRSVYLDRTSRKNEEEKTPKE
jgi:hypothetical protein